MTPEPITEALLARYIDGECTPDETITVQTWLKANPANQALLDDTKSRLTTRLPKPKWDIEAMWQNVRHSTEDAPIIAARQSTARARLSVGTPKTNARRYWYLATAAAAAITIAVGVSSRRNVSDAQLPQPREYKTQRGQQATLQLTDGTKLVLAADSKVRIPSEYGLKTRELFLEGEAILDVTHDSTRPFRVHSKTAVIEDIGTRFDVRAYSDDSVVTVAVAEGVVALGQRSNVTLTRDAANNGAPQKVEGVLLRQGDVGTLASDGSISTTRDPGIAGRFAWTAGRLEVVDARLGEVLRTVGRWYDLDLRAGSGLSNRRVTASLSVRSVDQMLNALALAVDARVERRGTVVTLRSK